MKHASILTLIFIFFLILMVFHNAATTALVASAVFSTPSYVSATANAAAGSTGLFPQLGLAWDRCFGYFRKARQRRNPLRKWYRWCRLQIKKRRRQSKKSGEAKETAIPSVEPGWSEMEFMGVNLGDKRLNKRLLKLADDLGAQPIAPINQACEDWADTKAAYRFFDNDKVKLSNILRPHQIRTLERIRNYRLILAVQDSSYLNYTAHPETIGLGPIGTPNQNQKGLVMHSSLAVTPDNLPLGVLTLKIWARKETANLTKSQAQKRPLEEKESYKWIEAFNEVSALAPEGVQLVHVCDRESDIYEFMVAARKPKGAYVIRAAHNRSVDSPDSNLNRLWSYMAQQPLAKSIMIEIPARGKQPKRIAACEVRFAPVKIKAPASLKNVPKSLMVDAIWLKEVNPPQGIEPVEWMLLTNTGVSNTNQALERIEWYTRRWQVENFHKVLKSGCTVEKCRLETAERLIRYITLMCVIAWRIHWMTHVSRQKPDAPATMVLADHEWKALYCHIHKTTRLPEQIPTVREVVRWIAQLGGFIGRKSDKEPGVTTIWRGWIRLNDIANMWRIFNPPKTYG